MQQQAPVAKGESINLAGFFRLQIEEDGKIVGNSGWLKNRIVDQGIEYYIAALIAGTTNSKQVGYVSLGSGGLPATNATILPSEVLENSKRAAITYGFTQRGDSTSEATLRFTATFASSDGFVSAQYNISNVGLNQTNTTNTSDLMCGNTFASSSCNTNQNVNVTYELRFAQTAD